MINESCGVFYIKYHWINATGRHIAGGFLFIYRSFEISGIFILDAFPLRKGRLLRSVTCCVDELFQTEQSREMHTKNCDLGFRDFV